MAEHADNVPGAAMMDAGQHRASGTKRDQVIAEHLRRQDAGQDVDVESLCAADPDIADEFREFISGAAFFDEAARLAPSEDRFVEYVPQIARGRSGGDRLHND